MQRDNSPQAPERLRQHQLRLQIAKRKGDVLTRQPRVPKTTDLVRVLARFAAKYAVRLQKVALVSISIICKQKVLPQFRT